MTNHDRAVGTAAAECIGAMGAIVGYLTQTKYDDQLAFSDRMIDACLKDDAASRADIESRMKLACEMALAELAKPARNEG